MNALNSICPFHCFVRKVEITRSGFRVAPAAESNFLLLVTATAVEHGEGSNFLLIVAAT